MFFYSLFTGFVYDGHGNAYIRCFYIGLKSAVSIGKNPKPGRNNVYEMGFMWVMWISGVFVFAILIGNHCLITITTAIINGYNIDNGLYLFDNFQVM